MSGKSYLLDTRVEVIGLDHSRTDLIRQAIEIRSQKKLKLPDAIVAASAAVNNAILISADHQFANIKGIEFVSF